MDFRTFSRRAAVVLVLLCTLMLCAVSAQAAAPVIHPIDVERVSLYPIPGVQYNTQPTVDGRLEVAFDCTNTDWGKALGCVGGANRLNACFKVDIPSYDSIVYRVSVQGSFADDDAILAEMERDILEHDYLDVKTYGSGYDFIFGEIAYVESAKKLAFSKSVSEDSNTTLAIGWYDADWKLVYAEKAQVIVGYSSSETLSNISPDCVKNYTANVNGLSCIDVERTDGKLTYRVNLEKAPEIDKDNRYIFTRFHLPAGTETIVEVDYFGNRKSFPLGNSSTWNIGVKYRNEDGSLSLGTDAEQCSYLFFDQAGNLLEGSGRLSITRINPDNAKLTFAYLDDCNWYPVPADRLVRDFGSAGHLLSTSYEDGHVFISAKKDIAITDQDARTLADTVKHYLITVPENAKSYRVGQMGGPGMFGSVDAESNQWMMQAEVLDLAKVIPVTASVIDPFSAPLFWQLSTSENGISLYNTSAETLDGRATLFAIEWFSDVSGQDWMYTEWFGETAEEIILTPKTVRYEDGDDLAGHKDTPAYADLMGSGYTLHASFRPQRGNNGFIIHLELHDENGNVVKNFGRNHFEFFIPYPVGNGPDRDYKYQLTHYFDDEMTGSEPVTAMIPEEHGIRFRLSSLSPIELTWEDVTPEAVPTPTPTPTPAPVPPADLPRTGDATPVGALMLMLAGSAAVLLIASRRRSA